MVLWENGISFASKRGAHILPDSSERGIFQVEAARRAGGDRNDVQWFRGFISSPYDISLKVPGSREKKEGSVHGEKPLA